MKLFLASIAAKSLDKIDAILPRTDRILEAAFIPTAADLYGKEPVWLMADRKKLEDKGFHVFDIDLKNKTKEELERSLGRADIIFVSGGNTFYLLEKVKESGFDEIIDYSTF